MKKILKCICIVLVLVICSGLTACGKDDPIIENENPFDSNNNTQTEMGDPSVGYNYDSAVPKAAKQAKTLFSISEPSDFSDKLTLATLQGLTANSSDEQIIISVGGGYNDYRKYIQDNWCCSVRGDIDGKPMALKGLLSRFKDSVSGYILCSADTESDSGSVAVSLAGILNAVVVTPKNKKLCEDVGLECVLDVSKKDDNWLRSSEYWSELNTKVAVEQPLNFAPKLVDYAVMCKAYFSFYDGTASDEHRQKYSYLEDGGLVFGYNNTLGELETVNSLSKENLQLIPSDHAYNLSVLSGFRATGFTQKTVTQESDNRYKHTVCIVMSDGDNVQWLLNDFAGNLFWYESPNRGQFDMGWGLPSTSVDLIAPMNAYLYDNMSQKDEFIMQLSGLGYTFPSRWSSDARKQMAQKLAEYMTRSNIDYAEILDDNGMNTETLSDFTSQDAVKGLFYIDYNDYSGKKGEILWTNNKPTVSAKYRLWADLPDGTIENIASSVNNASIDPQSAQSYSFIIVHAWSGLKGDKLVPGGNTMEAVARLVDSFDSNVDVVTPTEFMNRIIENQVK